MDGQGMRDVCRRAGKHSVRVGLTVLLATTALSGVALAEPNDCSPTSGTEAYLCTGDQSKGVTNGNSGTKTNARSISIKDLTPLSDNAPYTGPFKITSNQPATSVPSVGLFVELGDIEQVISHEKTRNVSATTTTGTSSADAADIEVTVKGNLTNEAAREVVELSSTGANGKNGGDASGSEGGKPGGDGGDGGDIVLTFGPDGGTSNLSGPNGDPVVVLSSSGGSGGTGSGGGGGGENASQTDGGRGGLGGAGGALTLLTNGMTTISSASGSISMRSDGNNGGSGGPAAAKDEAGGAGKGGQGGAGGDGGALFFDRDANGNSGTGSWIITARRNGVKAIALYSSGGNGSFSGGTERGDGAPGGAGGDAGLIAFGDVARSITVPGTGATAVAITGVGGNGDGGSSAGTDDTGKPGGGGAGGNGSRVALKGSWDIRATNEGSVGINVTTTGGSGGRAGFSSFTARSGGVGGAGGTISSVISADSTIQSDGTAIAFSSTGGTGGRGNDVNRDTSGGGNVGGAGGNILLDLDPSGATSAGSWTITTTSAPAIVLESTGGAGGDGGSKDGSDEVSNGGTGGLGGTGGAIEIKSGTRTITAAGSGSHGLYARAVGGAGGVGGEASGSGGAGGDGGVGGAIALDVDQQSGDTGWDITLIGGGGATGILLSSVGGQGGQSGQSQDESGRAGGEGGFGGDITAGKNTDRRFTLFGSGNRAFFATSEGGTGGRGGRATEGITSKRAGGGGRAGDGGDVDVGGNWTVVTQSGTSSGLILQSMGGIGGDGGTVPESAADNGGVGGSGGDAGGVYLTTQGDSTITVNGGLGIGLTSQAGNGGTGGTGTAYGGAAGGGGDAGPVTLDQSKAGVGSTGTWTITTTGSDAVGIEMYARGGDGAIGGKGVNQQDGGSGNGGLGGDILLAQGNRTISTAGEGAQAVRITSLGGPGGDTETSGRNVGAGGNGGDAGNITVSGTTTVVTRGSNADGLKIEALGGNGGKQPGSSASPFRPWNGGNGGDVTIESGSSIQATTYGPNAYGLFVFSEGGYGGAGNNMTGDSGLGGNISVRGDLTVETSGDQSPGIRLVSRGGLGSGSRGKPQAGGPVTMVADVSIQTAGDGALGLVALSRGGDSTGSAEDGGDGGIVNVSLIGGQGIITSGAGSHGVLAQSIGGKSDNDAGEASTVNVSTVASVITSGPGAQGIYAESRSDKSGGASAITVTVGADASVFGGLQSTDANLPDGAGIRIVGGTQDNRIINYGKIGYTPGSTSTGYAIVTVGDGYTTVGTGGIIYGNVIRDQSSADGNIADGQSVGIALINERSGIVNAGTRLDANVTNHGLLSPGGEGTQRTTAVSGDFRQTSTGTLAIEVSGEGTHDRVDVAGTASLNGAVELELTDLDSPLIGRQTRTILTADEGVTVAESLTLTQSLVASFELLDSPNDRVRIGFEVDFASDDATAALNNNQANIADHLQDLYEAGLIDTDLASALIALSDENDYASIVNNLSAEVALDNQMSAVQAFRAFQEQLLSCADTAGNGAVRFLDDGSCVFATARGAGFEREATSDNLGYDGSAWSVSGGGQVAIGEAWTIGGALGYEWQRLDVSGTSASSDGHSVFGGVSVKRHFGALELGASSSLGYGTYDVDRQPFPGSRVDADQNFWSLGGRVRAAYVFGSEKAFIKPRVDLGVDHVFGSRFEERGNTGVRLLVDTDDETYVSLAPAVEFGAEFVALDGVRIRPNITVGLTQYLNSPSPSLTAKFADAGTTVDGFDTGTDIATTFFDLSAGIDVFAADHAVLRAGAFTNLSEDDTIYGGSLRLEIPF